MSPRHDPPAHPKPHEPLTPEELVQREELRKSSRASLVDCIGVGAPAQATQQQTPLASQEQLDRAVGQVHRDVNDITKQAKHVSLAHAIFDLKKDWQ